MSLMGLFFSPQRSWWHGVGRGRAQEGAPGLEGRRRELLGQLLAAVGCGAAAAGRWQHGLRHDGFPAQRVLPALSHSQRPPRESRGGGGSQAVFWGNPSAPRAV